MQDMIRNSGVHEYYRFWSLYIIHDNKSLYMIQDNRYRVPVNVIITGTGFRKCNYQFTRIADARHD